MLELLDTNAGRINAIIENAEKRSGLIALKYGINSQMRSSPSQNYLRQQADSTAFARFIDIICTLEFIATLLWWQNTSNVEGWRLSNE